MSIQGYLSIILHAHLPFIRHPEFPDFLEEDWLFEAMTETYIPILRMMDRLTSEGIYFRLTMSLTPPLCEMLADPLLEERYLAHLDKLRRLADIQAKEKMGTPFQDAAQSAAIELGEAERLYEEVWNRQLLPQFKRFQDMGVLEIITCGATHGFLPLMATDEARRAQISVAVNNYKKHFARAPRGIWLPECAFAPGLDELLAEHNIKFFVLESHALTAATPPARYGTFRPIVTPSGVAAFARDLESSRQVWSAEIGYPGHPNYREFYRDCGFDLPYAEVKPYLHLDGVRRNTGLKFHRITGKVALNHKEPYVPTWASQTAAEHAGNFLFNRQAQCRHLRSVLGTIPHITAPYDAELYGHWWYEGPQFLEILMRKAAFDQNEIKMITPSEYLAKERVHQEVTPALSSWGANGFFEVWLNSSNDWIYRYLHLAEEQMVELAQRFPDADGLLRRALNQAARELLLAQSSDWAFIITTNTSVEYAEKRTRDHIARFTGIYDQITQNRLEPEWIAELEWKDTIFQEIDYRVYTPRHQRAKAGAVFTS
ncbi:MAG: 1,4-alpha-glucan branching protein domain-containing protein [Bradymonadales bacterium]|jgi:1,4-alpha-glucan branching enzyme